MATLSKMNSTHKDGISRRLLLTISVALVLLGMLLVLLVIAWQHSNNRKTAIGPSVPWDVQLSLAQQAASKVDSGAVLFAVIAFASDTHVGKAWTVSDTLTVRFQFATTSNREITVRLNDSNPTDTLSVIEESIPAPAIVQQNAQDYHQRISTVRISPREAGQFTWQEVTAEASKNRTKLTPLIYLNLYTTPASWNVHYKDADKALDVNHLEDIGYKGLYVVDAQLGKIIERNLQP